MKMRVLFRGGLSIGPMLTGVFAVIVLLADSSTATLQSMETRQDWQDLEVITLDSQGNRAKTVYYSYDQLLTLRMVTVKTERDPNTNTPATYTGLYISDLFEAFGADTSFDVIGANRLDRYKQYYDRDYVTRHRPILLLKFDDKVPDDWPQTEDRNALGPYCIVHESFVPSERIYSCAEQPRSMYGVVSLELTRFPQSLGRFAPKEGGNDPEVAKGQKIAINSCSSCHNSGNAGGQVAGTPWSVLAATVVSSKDKFRMKVTNPRSLNPTSGMPPHPEFDDNTFNALEAYFKAVMPTK
ncbi:MAG TPA: cytochrome c [Chthoniobacterales bacterium]|nr:cytochrome c [Chthoniobacterales bacterium]